MVVGKSNDMQCHNCVGETVPNQTTQHDLIHLNSAIVHFAKIPVNSSLQIDPNKSSTAFIPLGGKLFVLHSLMPIDHH